MPTIVEVMIRTPSGIDDGDLAPLREALPHGYRLCHDVGVVRLVDTAETAVQGSDQASGRQFSLGLDPSTILAVLIAPLPVIFVKTLAEQAAVDFWLGLKRLLAKVARSHKAIPLTSIQVQFQLDTYRNVPVIMAITYLNAVYVSEATWSEMIETCRGGAQEHLGIARKFIEAKAGNGKRAHPAASAVVIHALIDGGAAPVWQIVAQGPRPR